MFPLSGPAHGRISAMPHKGFLEKQQKRPVVSKGQYVPAAHRQGGDTNEKRRHTSKASSTHAGKAAAHRRSGGTQARQQCTGKAAAHRRSGGHRQNEDRSAAESRKKFRRLGLPVCTAVGFCPAVFCTREPCPGRPVWTLWESCVVWIRAFRLRRPACLPDGSLWDFLPCLQLSARIFSSSSCR